MQSTSGLPGLQLCPTAQVSRSSASSIEFPRGIYRHSHPRLAAYETLKMRSSLFSTGSDKFASTVSTGIRNRTRREGKGQSPCGAPRASVVEFLPKEYGYVVLVAASSAILVQWQAIEVSKQRVKAGIKYPKMYSDEETGALFNCYQRAHQNTLESYPSFLALLLCTGLAYPKVATIFGAMFVVGRIFYTLGYYTGEPRNRFRGMWGQLGLFGLIGTAGVFGVTQLL